MGESVNRVSRIGLTKMDSCGNTEMWSEEDSFPSSFQLLRIFLFIVDCTSGILSTADAENSHPASVPILRIIF